MADSGKAVRLAVSDGSSYNNLGDEQSSTLNLTTDSADVTNKDDAEWHADLNTIRNWSIDFTAHLNETDTAYTDLEDAYFNNTQPSIRFVTAAPNTFTGTVTVSDLTLEGPHDNAITLTGSLTGDGTLSKA